MLIPEIEIDATLNFSDITPSFFNIIKQFAPFGPGNMNPIFLTENVSDKGYANIVGSNHLKMDLIQQGRGMLRLRSAQAPDEGQVKFPAIGFGLGEHFEFVAKKNSFNVCYHINEQQWDGKTYLQLNVKDLKK